MKLAQSLLEITNSQRLAREYAVKAKVDSILEDIDVVATVAAGNEETELCISTFPVSNVEMWELYQSPDNITPLGKAVLHRLTYEGFDALFYQKGEENVLWLSWEDAWDDDRV